ncbi:hypothetical protein [Actinoplanes philippinensis]|uniref:hypothetical protein n=1 Tax=Actinoplanes philippinensis TaxID=35752 RepID=UPI0033F0D1EF
MSIPEPASIQGVASIKPVSPQGFGRRVISAIVAVVVVTGVSCVSALIRHRAGEGWTGPVGLPAAGTVEAHEKDLTAVQGHPRLMINEPGWKMTEVSHLGAAHGSIVFTNRARRLAMYWYPADQYDRYLKEQQPPGTFQATTVAGVKAVVAAGDVILEPRDGTFVELRAEGMGFAKFRVLLSHVVHLSPEKFLASLPPEVVTPGEIRSAAADFLADVPIPPAFDVASIDMGAVNFASVHVAAADDAHYFSERVISQIACAWIAEWIRADADGDGAAVEDAIAALRTSRNWKVLKDLTKRSSRPAVIWVHADQVANGWVADDYRGGLYCNP